MSPEEHREHRARRRAIAMEHHPDRGGDPAEFDRAMRALDEPPGPAARGTRHEIVITPSTRTRLRRGVAATRGSVTSYVTTYVTTHVGRPARLTRRAP